MISETDLEIVNALQINPRADWSRVGDVLGLSGPTVARRWNSLAEQGLAWITPAPGPRYLSAGWSAFISLSSLPSENEALVQKLCAEPAFGTVSLVSGSHDLFMDCFASSHEELMDIVTGSFAGLPGVTHREVVFVTKLYRQASDWRSGTLEPARARLMSAEPRPPRPATPPTGWTRPSWRNWRRTGGPVGRNWEPPAASLPKRHDGGWSGSSRPAT